MFGWLGRFLFGAPERYPQTNPFGIRGLVERVRADIPAWIVSSERGSRTILMVEARWAFWALSPPARQWRTAYWNDPYSGLSCYCYDGSTAFLIVLWDCAALREAIPIDLSEAYGVLRRDYFDYVRAVPTPRRDEWQPDWLPPALPPGNR